MMGDGGNLEICYSMLNVCMFEIFIGSLLEICFVYFSTVDYIHEENLKEKS